MKKRLMAVVLSFCLLFAACAAFAEADAPCVTLYANGGTLTMDGGAEETTLLTAALEPDQTFGEALGLDRILSVNKENEVFAGWTVYDVAEMETSETYVMDDEAICIALPEGGYLVLRSYSLVSSLISIEELAEYTRGEYDVVVVANWLTEEEANADIRMPGELGVTVFANGGALMMGGSEATLFAATREPGMTFGEMLGLENLRSIHKDGAVFAGWTVYVEDPDASVDAGGVLCFEMDENQPMSASTYAESYWMVSTEELAEIVCEEENYIIVANWMSEDEEFEYEESYEEYEEVVLPSITLLSGEGVLLIDGEEEQYETTMRVVSAEPGQTFGEALELDTVASVTAEGAEFTGWTVYEYDVETMETSETSIEEEGALCFEVFEDYYMVLRNYEICEKLISTEELAEIVCGEPDHLVIANFQ